MKNRSMIGIAIGIATMAYLAVNFSCTRVGGGKEVISPARDGAMNMVERTLEQRYELVFGVPMTDEQQKLMDYIVNGEGDVRKVLLMDIPGVIVGDSRLGDSK